MTKRETKKSETETTNSVYEKTITKEITHYLSTDVIKNNDNKDQLLESGIVDVGILKYDSKYDSGTEGGKF